MTGELARGVLNAVVDARPMKTLTWSDRGRVVAVETPAAVYVGILTSFIMHKHEAIHVYIEREGTKADFNTAPETIIYFGSV